LQAMTSRSLSAALALSFASAFFLLIASGRAAERHIDCDKVMHELVNGKSAQEVAKAFGISPAAVYDCENAEAAKVSHGMPSAMPSMSVPSRLTPPTSSPR